ncbi:DUF2804 domain-containing protein [Clostridium bowmanii]|uniref:DUF2804 domain-containing protein n=1 Tax=Clostridium bowmanii TaxID=132925 RepID=UPI001CD683BA|nr:DUF2804 domain-containing protein [Clostridium bowmanii]MCA1074925.1 DUF2804 domain-containing protein [Clostridium bowmanii]
MINEELYKEKEIPESVDLCDCDGKINEESIGWSRNAVFNCNIKGSWLRKKKWNYWCITNNECLFSVTISNIDYLGMAFVYFLDFKTKEFVEKTIMTPFGRGYSMPNKVHETVIFKNSKIELYFIEEESRTQIVAKCNDFMGNLMEANFNVIYPKGHETLNVVVPFSKNSFQFTSKHECLPVDGMLKIGEKVYSFNPENTFACLDFGRGIWPYSVKWNWANASGIIKDKGLGLNLGGKWTDGIGMTENCIIVDGKITKLSEDVLFEYDSKNFMKPWIIKTSITNRIKLTFVPFYERIAKSNLVILKSDVHQMIGHFSGSIETDAGENIIIDSLIGCCEEHLGKW